MSLRISTEKLIDYTVQQATQKFIKWYPFLAGEEEPFKKFNEKLGQLGQTLKTNRETGFFVQRAQEVEGRRRCAEQLKKFAQHCKSLVELSCDLEGAVAAITPVAEENELVQQIKQGAPTAFAALQKTDEYVSLKMKELRDKQSQVDTLKERMQKTYQEAEALLEVYQQLIVKDKEGDEDWDSIPEHSSSASSSSSSLPSSPSPSFPPFTITLELEDASRNSSSSSSSSSDSSSKSEQPSDSASSSSSSVTTRTTPSSSTSSEDEALEVAQPLDRPHYPLVTNPHEQKPRRCETFISMWRACTTRPKNQERTNSDM